MVLNILVGSYYLGLSASCLVAAYLGSRHYRGKRVAFTFLAGAGLFLLLAIMRYFGVDEYLRDVAREYLRQTGLYAARRELQAPFFIAAAMCVAGCGGLAWWLWPSRNAPVSYRLVRTLQIAMLGYVPLYFLRLVSLHAVDRLMHAGPLPVSWLAEGILVLLATSATVLFIRRTRMKSGSLPEPR